MRTALDYLKGVVSSDTAEGYQWEDILGAVDVVFAEPLNREVERVMLAILRLDRRIPLAESSELPHSMPPEDALKSIAVQWLARETGLTHLSEMQRVEATAMSLVLASAVRATIRETARNRASKEKVEVVPLFRSPPRSKTLVAVLSRGIGKRHQKVLPRVKPAAAAAQPSALGNYTVYRVPVVTDRRSIVSKAVILDQGLSFFVGSAGAMVSPEEAAVRTMAFKKVRS
jgi:hypothetical protein